MSSRFHLGRLIVLGALLVPAGLIAQRQTRTVFVNAVDASGAPVLNLTAADFDVKEGDAKRAVTYAGLATGPMRIIVLMDTSQPAEPFQGQMKAALTAFTEGIPEPNEIGIMSMGRGFKIRLAPTADRAKIKDAVNKFSFDGGGMMFFDALRETESRFQKKEGVRWPVYVMFVTDGQEASTAIQNEEFQRLATDLIARGTTVHSLILQKFGPTPITDIASTLAKNTGGLLDMVTVPQTFVEKFKATAARIVSDHEKMATRYQVEYASDMKYTGGVDVGIVKEGIRGSISLRRSF